MDVKLTRKLVVNVAGIVIAVGLLTALYIIYLRPHVEKWREARTELRDRKERLEDLREAFGDQRDPQVELDTLRTEVQNLVKANEAIKKVKTIGVETESLPAELHDPDEEIRRELYRDYMKSAMETSENTIKDKLKSAKIIPPDLNLYTQLDNADEAAYYTNRARGLQGIVNALVKTRTYGGNLIFDNLFLEDYNEGKKSREGAVNIIKYTLNLSMDTRNLVSFLYNLQEEDSYYFVEDMKIEPRGGGRGSSTQQLSVETTINTTMVFESQVKAQVKATAEAIQRATGDAPPPSGLAALFLGMQEQLEEEERRLAEKKWWQFWIK
jgi:hypothetical protein